MRLGVLTASASNKAGGIFGAMLGQNMALHNHFLLKPQIFGLHDELSEQDRAAWDPLPVTFCATKGPHTFGYSPELVPALQQANLDLLHVHGLWMYPSIASMTWAKHVQKPYITTIHGMLDPWAVRNARAKKLLAGWLYENYHLRNAACLQAVTESEVRSIRAYGLNNPVCLIPYGIEIPNQTGYAAGNIRNPKELLYLGRIHPKKGLVNLLRAWHALHRLGNDPLRGWTLTIAGWDQGGHEDELKALSNQLGLDGSIKFIGPQFGVRKEAVYCAAQAFILPSFSEGLPVAALEAWSYKLPVLITPECNIPDGFSAEAAIRIGTDPEKIVDGIRQLVAMKDDDRRTMGLRGRNLVEKRFSWPMIAGQMYAVYRWILGDGPKPDCICD